MDARDGNVATVGSSPLVRLRRLSEATGRDIPGKAEIPDPGGSVTDRAALATVSPPPDGALAPVQRA